MSLLTPAIGLSIGLLLLRQVLAQGQCYFPPTTANQLGYQATEQRPCDAFAETSLCCPLGWTCFGNGLCIVTDAGAVGGLWPLGTALRGTCTNPLWDKGVCGGFCLNNPILQNNGSLEYCGNGNWCCGPAAEDGSCDCQSKQGTFEIPDGIAQTIIGVTGMKSTSTFFTAAFTSQPSSQSVSTTQTASFVTLSSSLGRTTWATSTSNSQGKTSTSSSSRTSSTAQSTAIGAASQQSVPITQKTAFKAGMGVFGGVIGLALIFFVAFLIWRRKRKGRSANLPPDDDSSIYSQPQPPMIRADPDPYALAIPPRSQARESPISGVVHNQTRNKRIDSELSRPPPPNVDPYIMPYEGT